MIFVANLFPFGSCFDKYLTELMHVAAAAAGNQYTINFVRVSVCVYLFLSHWTLRQIDAIQLSAFCVWLLVTESHCACVYIFFVHSTKEEVHRIAMVDKYNEQEHKKKKLDNFSLIFFPHFF